MSLNQEDHLNFELGMNTFLETSLDSYTGKIISHPERIRNGIEEIIVADQPVSKELIIILHGNNEIDIYVVDRGKGGSRSASFEIRLNTRKINRE
ncbi:hypothetical protein FHS19_003129 [Paenibacillus rhizosphaerae]|uniref:Uncharacterized protein n=1 Tax=Paenibacillus rhizosphaerae TaxID=297318 RepID=A0A839TNY0_9BACL|nr:hypothetical protein [Paenibacillus rhizosphaerae]MBB3128475.1 hypothetical protein [Paenibacillus rhizosphaerae]